jgi:hypothetical protein
MAIDEPRAHAIITELWGSLPDGHTVWMSSQRGGQVHTAGALAVS